MPVEKLIGRLLRRATQLEMNFGNGVLAPPKAPEQPVLLYVHVPFCHWLCPFCTFHRVQFDADRARHYFSALRSEISRYWNLGFRFADVYVGGGTPTVLPDELARTIDLIRSLGMPGEVSVETNPNHLQPDIAATLCGAGVDRLSVGVQSFDNALLREMGRFEPYGSAEQIAERLAWAQGRFSTLNVDLIFNFPNQSVASLHRDIAMIKELAVDQVSCYPLMPAAETGRAMARHMGQVDFGREKKAYEQIVAGLSTHYQPTSAWCFSRQEGLIDEYIAGYDQYLGVGSGSFSYLGGTLYSSSFSINRYLDRIAAGDRGIVMQRSLSPREQLRYTLLVGLFGLSLPVARLGEARGKLWKELAFFRSLGAIRRDNDHYRLTQKGMYLWVVMMREFLMGINRFREQMRHHIRSESRQTTRVEMEGTVPVAVKLPATDGGRQRPSD